MTNLIKFTTLAIVGMGLSIPATAQDAAPANARRMAAATPQQIVASIKSCSVALSATGVDDAKLRKAGWTMGTLKRGSEAIESVRVYSRTGVNTLILLPPASRKGMSCIVTGRMGSVTDVATAANMLSREVGTKPVRGQGQWPTWMAGERAIQLNTTGTANSPSVRAIVAYSKGSKG